MGAFVVTHFPSLDSFEVKRAISGPSEHRSMARSCSPASSASEEPCAGYEEPSSSEGEERSSDESMAALACPERGPGV